MMKLGMRKIFPSHLVTLGFVTAAVIILNLFVSVVVSPHFKDGLSVEHRVIVRIQIAFALFIYASLIAAVVLLLVLMFYAGFFMHGD